VEFRYLLINIEAERLPRTSSCLRPATMNRATLIALIALPALSLAPTGGLWAQAVRAPALGPGAARPGRPNQPAGSAHPATGANAGSGQTQAAGAGKANGAGATAPLDHASLVNMFDLNRNGKLDPAEITAAQAGLSGLGGNAVGGIPQAHAAAV